MTANAVVFIRELDARVSNGIQVRLLWTERSERPWVAVLDTRTGEAFQLTVAKDESPLDMFRHPFAYATDTRREPLATHNRAHQVPT